MPEQNLSERPSKPPADPAQGAVGQERATPRAAAQGTAKQQVVAQKVAAPGASTREQAARVAAARAAAARVAAARRPTGRPAPARKGLGKREFKIGVDVLMLVLFLYLMSYHPGGGLLLHAYLGCALFVLFILHHALNWNWHRTLFQGKYNLRRSLTSGTDVLLLGAMVMAMVSSWHIASMALPFEFLPPPRNTWRDLHVAATAWCFVLMAFHLGLHLHNTITKWERQLAAQRALRWGFKLFQVLLLLGAGWSLWHNNVGHDLLMLPTRPVAFNALAFYLEHLAIIAGFAVLTHGLLSAITPQRTRSK